MLSLLISFILTLFHSISEENMGAFDFHVIWMYVLELGIELPSITRIYVKIVDALNDDDDDSKC